MKQLIPFLIFLALIISSCSTQKCISSSPDVKISDQVYFFNYLNNGDQEELVAKPVDTGGDSSLTGILTITMGRLSLDYSKSSTVTFELASMNVIHTEERDFRIAVFNIADSGKVMEREYFQGSMGGRQTQRKILMNLLQPQAEGFLDGCIIQMNDKPVGLMDHVNFDGILLPSVYAYEAGKAVRNYIDSRQ